MHMPLFTSTCFISHALLRYAIRRALIIDYDVIIFQAASRLHATPSLPFIVDAIYADVI